MAEREIEIAPDKIRVALFGSFYRGYCVLQELLHGWVSDQIEIVGVATDDPKQTFVGSGKRAWQYSHEPFEETMVEEMAMANSIDTYTGRVKTSEFLQRFTQAWQPDICLMATFGQRVDEPLFSSPRLGFYNFHPCYGDKWPSYPGPNPFKEMLEDGKDSCVVAMHHVNERFDDGELVAFSDRVYFPLKATVIDLHKLTSPIAGKFAASQLEKIIEADLAESEIANIIYENPSKLELSDLTRIANAIGGVAHDGEYQLEMHFTVPNGTGSLIKYGDRDIPVLRTSTFDQFERSEKLRGMAIVLNERRGRVAFVSPDYPDPNRIMDPRVGLTISTTAISRTEGITYYDQQPRHEIRDWGIRKAASIATHRELAAMIQVDLMTRQFAAEKGIDLWTSELRQFIINEPGH